MHRCVGVQGFFVCVRVCMHVSVCVCMCARGHSCVPVEKTNTVLSHRPAVFNASVTFLIPSSMHVTIPRRYNVTTNTRHLV